MFAAYFSHTLFTMSVPTHVMTYLAISINNFSQMTFFIRSHLSLQVTSLYVCVCVYLCVSGIKQHKYAEQTFVVRE